MPAPFRPNSRALVLANAAQTAYALAVIKQFKAGFVPNPATVVADLDAVECDYDDYAPLTITAWFDPALAPSGGWQITAPTSQALCAADQVVSNMVGGWWMELAAGDVFVIRQFDAPVPMAVAGNFIQITPTEVFGNGA